MIRKASPATVGQRAMETDVLLVFVFGGLILVLVVTCVWFGVQAGMEVLEALL